MKYALIGCGRVAVNHLKAAKANGLEITAVCDIENAQIDTLFARLGWEETEYKKIKRYSDYAEMLEKEDLELLSIALPSGLHAQCAFEVIKHGGNVIIEKPIALSLQDADRIIALSEEYGVCVSACHQNRFNLSVQEMRKALDAGRFGALSNAAVTVRWSRDETYYAAAPWRGTWEMDGGCLMNQCIHGIDLLLWMCGGEVKTVYGKIKRGFHPYMQAEDAGTAVIEFRNGVIATIEGTVNVFGPDMEEHLTLIGRKGTMKLGGKSANTVEYRYFAGEDVQKNSLVEQTQNVYGNGHTSLFADVIDAIREDRPPYVTALDGRKALEAVLAVYQSAAEGREVNFPLPDTKTTDFEGYFEDDKSRYF